MVVLDVIHHAPAQKPGRVLIAITQEIKDGKIKIKSALKKYSFHTKAAILKHGKNLNVDQLQKKEKIIQKK